MSYTIEYIINHILTDVTNPRISVKDPCRVCHKTVKVDHQAILCKSCEFLVHIGCNGITQNKYDHLQHNSESWNCLICNIKTIFIICPSPSAIIQNYLLLMTQIQWAFLNPFRMLKL